MIKPKKGMSVSLLILFLLSTLFITSAWGDSVLSKLNNLDNLSPSPFPFPDNSTPDPSLSNPAVFFAHVLDTMGGGEADLLNPRTGMKRFMKGKKGKSILQPSPLSPKAGPEEAARNFLKTYGKEFGIKDDVEELELKEKTSAENGRSIVKFRQVHEGVPIFGAELVVQMDSSKNVLSVNGEISPSPIVNVMPMFSAEDASTLAIDFVTSEYRVDGKNLKTSKPELWIYNPALLGYEQNQNIIVWLMEVKAADFSPIRELVLVDADQGTIVFHLDEIYDALNRVCV